MLNGTKRLFLQRLFPPRDFTWTGFHDLFAVIGNGTFADLIVV